MFLGRPRTYSSSESESETNLPYPDGLIISVFECLNSVFLLDRIFLLDHCYGEIPILAVGIPLLRILIKEVEVDPVASYPQFRSSRDSKSSVAYVTYPLTTVIDFSDRYLITGSRDTKADVRPKAPSFISTGKSSTS